MNKQTAGLIPDYSLFHRDIKETSSPVIDQEEELRSSSSSSDEIKHFQTIIDENSFPSPPPPPPLPQRKLNSYASTDEDVDELNLDSSEDIDRSAITIQTYRDRLAARLHGEQPAIRSRMVSTEYSQITLDSGVDFGSEPRVLQPRIDELFSEETANQNDLFALSDDSLLDIESPQSQELAFRSPPMIHERSSSVNEESDEGRSFSTAITDDPVPSKTERGPSNTSETYYSAESEFNTSLSPPNNDREPVTDAEGQHELVPPPSPPLEASTDVRMPSFSDWIDRVFTDFLADTRPDSISSSRSSSLVSMHASHTTIDSSSSAVVTVIERHPPDDAASNEASASSNAHRRSQSWPNEDQHPEADHFKGKLSLSLLCCSIKAKKAYFHLNVRERTAASIKVTISCRGQFRFSAYSSLFDVLDMSSSSLNNTDGTSRAEDTNALPAGNENNRSGSLLLPAIENADDGGHFFSPSPSSSSCRWELNKSDKRRTVKRSGERRKRKEE